MNISKDGTETITMRGRPFVPITPTFVTPADIALIFAQASRRPAMSTPRIRATYA